MTDANASLPPGENEHAGAGVRWEIHALAIGRVVRATGWPESAAAEWLRQQALDEVIRVRFQPTWIPRTDDNRRREGLRHMYPDRREDGGDISECIWRTPIDDLRDIGPPAMGEYWMKFVEWDAEGLGAALVELRSGLEAEAQLGRPPEWPWTDIVAEVAMKFALGGGGDKPEVLVATVQDVAQRMTGHRPSRSRAQPFAKVVRAAWERHSAAAKK